MTNAIRLGASLFALVVAGPALAQSGSGGSGAVNGDQDVTAAAVPTSSRAAANGPEVIVTGALERSERDVLQGTSVLTGEALTRDLRPSIGETLARLPGVSATSFGPTASRPILRGFQGDRIRVLTDGIGSVDVSNTSVDHAVVIDPLLAERIEVLRGPSALLFGSSAVGGVVNVVDTRIPRTLPENGYRLNGIANYGSAANERSVEGAGDVAVGQHLVLHADGSYLKTDNLRIGGNALSGTARAAALSQVGLPQNVEAGEEPIDFAASAAIRGKLPNSFSQTWTAGAGASLVTDTGSLGVSYSHYDSFYGIPIRYATQVGQEQEGPRLDLVQNRVDLRGEVETGGNVFDRIRIRIGHANYRHFELEEDGSIGTAFYNNGTEGRLELVQARRSAWSGASGVQFFNRQFDVQGDEAFLPRNETNQTGLFTVQQLDFGALKAEGGLRYEWSNLTAKNDPDDRFFVGRRTFHALSGSLGASYGIGDSIRIGLNGSHTERAPSAEEIFANGGHAGTQAYELGNPDFRLEKSWGLEATFHAHTGSVNLDASAYYNWFTDYISENQVAQAVCQAAAAPSGREADLPCFQYQQGDARYYGFEADLSASLFTLGTTRFNADLLGDYVHANIVDVGPVPRIPAPRVLGGLEAQGNAFTARAEVEHVFDQNRTAAFETPTNDYTMVNASVSLSPFGRDSKTQLVLSANNIFDVTARRASSFLKDFAPLAGRDLRATLRFGI